MPGVNGCRLAATYPVAERFEIDASTGSHSHVAGLKELEETGYYRAGDQIVGQFHRDLLH